MNLIEEYLNQQIWRNWDRYFQNIPLGPNDHVVDLGCSVGAVSTLFAKKARWVTGFDVNEAFIAYCDENRLDNQTFIQADFNSFDFKTLSEINGVWASFSLSYIVNPIGFLTRLFPMLPKGGWVALVDISCFLSGNMNPNSPHHGPVEAFERRSADRPGYDFEFGSKMRRMLETAGFNLMYEDNNVEDLELNFDGAARSDVLKNWRARLERLQGLKKYFPATHSGIVEDLMTHLSDPLHHKNKNVRFVVGRKQ